MKTSTLIGLLLLAILCSPLNGCLRTIAPKPAKPTTASFSSTADPLGNYQNSGVMGWITNHSIIINGTGRLTYNSLIARGYGQRLTPPLQPTNLDQNLTPYTNNPVQPLYLGKDHGWVTNWQNPGDLWLMNPKGVDDWPSMTTVSRDLSPMVIHPVKPP